MTSASPAGNDLATAIPIPCVPPVITAFLPSYALMLLSSPCNMLLSTFYGQYKGSRWREQFSGLGMTFFYYMQKGNFL